MMRLLFLRITRIITIYLLITSSLIFSYPTSIFATTSFVQTSPIIGDYGGEIREKHPRKDGIKHIDTPKLIEKLIDLKVNTYFFLIWHSPTDWDDLRKEFLPEAQKAGIDVWVYLVPPTESIVKASEPFGTDYIAWFRAVGRLSRHFPNLKGIVIDDFNHNLDFFHPNYLKKMREAGKQENPNLLFYPQIYYPVITEQWLKQYRPWIDGIVMAFRDDHYRNTQNIDQLTRQIDHVESVTRPFQLPFILMVYASRLSATPANPSVSYVENTLKIALLRQRIGQIHGVVTYVLHKEWEEHSSDITPPSGKAYASFFAPSVSNGKKGDAVEWVQRIYTDHADKKQLTFWHFSVYPSNLPSRSFQKQILVDKKVVWQKSVRSNPSGKWIRETIDLTPHLKNKKTALISIRLLRDSPKPLPWTYSGFDAFTSTGFTIQNPDFEQKEMNWLKISNTRALIGDILEYDPKRQQKTYLVTKKLMNTWHFYQSIIDQTNQPLMLRKADHLLTAVLLDQVNEAKQTIEELIQLILFDRQIPLKSKQKWIREGYQLYNLFNNPMLK